MELSIWLFFPQTPETCNWTCIECEVSLSWDWVGLKNVTSNFRSSLLVILFSIFIINGETKDILWKHKEISWIEIPNVILNSRHSFWRTIQIKLVEIFATEKKFKAKKKNSEKAKVNVTESIWRALSSQGLLNLSVRGFNQRFFVEGLGHSCKNEIIINFRRINKLSTHLVVKLMYFIGCDFDKVLIFHYYYLIYTK